MLIKGPLAGSILSQDAYASKRANIDAHQGQWVRRTSIQKRQVVIPLPDGADLGPPRWPKVLTDGDWETIVTRVFDNRYIKSLDDKAARDLAALE
jgi:hypothetical protein